MCDFSIPDRIGSVRCKEWIGESVTLMRHVMMQCKGHVLANRRELPDHGNLLNSQQ